jgi:hypothetical protein
MSHNLPADMLCGRCRRPLDELKRYEGGRLVGIDYLHPAVALPEDHAPEPIPARGPASAVTACDFCATPGATWEYPARSFDTAEVVRLLAQGETDLTIHRSKGAWGACNRCHDAIEAGDWNKLMYRALRRHRASLRPSIEPRVRALWFAFERHRTGPPRRR